MSKPCRLSFAAFKFGEMHKGEWYDDRDLLNGIDYCQNLIALGYLVEPLDGFPLRPFIRWARKQLTTP